MKISMCVMPQQNAYVERVQGTIKNQYFSMLGVTSVNLQSLTRKIIGYYNTERPHSNLKRIPPSVFAAQIKQQSKRQRPKLKIHDGYAITVKKMSKNDDMEK